jgi:uncharacterized protein (DUF924 family)
LADDLGLADLDVHVKAKEVLGFWFDLAMPEQWFAKSDSFDDEVRALFGPLRDLVLGSGAAGWRDDPDTLLAAIIVLDQFSRNIHRGTAEAFAADPLAQELTALALVSGWDEGMSAERRQFLYMPLMHAEDRELQALCLKCFDSLGREENIAFAREHAAVIERFGRFPTRNAALGRETTPAETEWLAASPVSW